MIDPKRRHAIALYIERHYISEKPLMCAPQAAPELYMERESAAPRGKHGFSMPKAAFPGKGRVSRRKLEDLVEQLDETFSQKLLRLIRERDLKESEVYKRALVDRRHFSKIKNDADYTPNKKTVLAFSIALELSLDETKDLLNCAGYALSRSSRSDVIISYFLENQVYDIFEINEALYEFGQPVFEG